MPTTQVAKRLRESPFPLVTVDQAVSMVLEHTQVLPTVSLDLNGKYIIYFF